MTSHVYRVHVLSLVTLVTSVAGLIGVLFLWAGAWPVNLLHVGPPSNPYHTMDMPVYLLYAEAILYLLLVVGAALAAASTTSGNLSTAKSISRALAVLLALAWVGHGATAAWRTIHLYSSIDGSCGDVSTRSACPATRVNRTLTHSEHLGGDCVFWYWGDMQSREDAVGGHVSVTTTDMLDLMDWSRHAPYGYSLLGDEIVYGGERLFAYQDTLSIIPADQKITAATVPDISHCWYWGCHPVCNEERFFINRAMMWLGGIWALVEIILFAIAVTFARIRVEKTKEVGDLEEPFKEPGARIPQPPTTKVVLGRRLRF